MDPESQRIIKMWRTVILNALRDLEDTGKGHPSVYAATSHPYYGRRFHVTPKQLSEEWIFSERSLYDFIEVCELADICCRRVRNRAENILCQYNAM